MTNAISQMAWSLPVTVSGAEDFALKGFVVVVCVRTRLHLHQVERRDDHTLRFELRRCEPCVSDWLLWWLVPLLRYCVRREKPEL